VSDISVFESLERKILKRGPRMLKSSRWEHSLRTAEYAEFLAKHYGVEARSCRIAALAHDLARGFSLKKQARWAERELGDLPDFLVQAPQLLHGPASANYLRRLGCRDESVLSAVSYHTTGHPDLDDTGLIVFAADYMEPDRTHLSDGDREALLALSLSELVLSILGSMDAYLASKGIVSAPWSRELSLSLKNRYNGAL
jgi:predicted HD superfamily hydrolase involved in NAD metabolism